MNWRTFLLKSCGIFFQDLMTSPLSLKFWAYIKEMKACIFSLSSLNWEKYVVVCMLGFLWSLDKCTPLPLKVYSVVMHYYIFGPIFKMESQAKVNRSVGLMGTLWSGFEVPPPNPKSGLMSPRNFVAPSFRAVGGLSLFLKLYPQKSNKKSRGNLIPV